MSDFLATLAAHATRTVLTVRPRLPGRFEPARQAAPAAPGDDFEVVTEALAPVPPSPPAPSLPPSGTPPGVPAGKPDARETPPGTEGTRLQPAVEPTPVVVSRHADAAPPTALPAPTVLTPPRAVVPPIPAAVRPVALDVPRPEPAAPRSAQRLPSESEATLQRVLPRPITVPLEQTVVRALARPQQTPQSSGTEEATRERKAPAAAVPVVLPQPVPVGRQESARDLAPTVQVTIGRIEVRAILATSAPPPRPAPKRPVTSLEDYLRARSGEQR
jgi:hypothetical protein